MGSYRPDLFLLLIGAAVLGMAMPASAQSVQTNQADLSRSTQPTYGPTPVPGFVEGHAVESPNDADLGEQAILQRAPEYKPLTLSAVCPIFYTSNVALTRSGELSDLVIAPLVAVYYQPRITNTLYANIDARQQIFKYTDNHIFDFGSLDVEAGLNYFLPQFHNLILRGEYDFNRLTNSDRLGDEFFANHALIFNAELPFRFSRAQQLSVGTNENISVAADHQSPRRNDYEGYVAYSATLTRALSVNAVGRLVLRDYHQNGRTDLSEIISINASYRLTNWCYLSAISSFAHSDSNQDVFDYNVVNLGGALALEAKF